MPDELKSELPDSFTFSQSSLQDYFDCPRRFQLRYLEHLAWPAVEAEPLQENERHIQDGQHFHRLVQQYLIGLPVEILAPLANTLDLSRWWENYIHYNLDITDYTQYAELTLIAACGAHRLLAKYDLLAMRAGQRAIIFDWKTTHKRPRNEWMAARMQTRVYRALLVQAGAYLNGGMPIQPEHVEMIYWYADFPSEPAHFPYQETQYKRDWAALRSIIAEINNHRHFPMTENVNVCNYCPYRSYCNRGGEAGALGESDIGMEEAISEHELNYEQIAEIEF